MIKILFLIHDLGPGGAEKVLVNLVNNMSADKFDITVLALFGGGVNEKFLKPHIRYRSVFPREIRGNSHIMKLFPPRWLHKWFVREHYDVEVSYLEGPSARIVSACPDLDTKLVSWIHCTMHTRQEFAVGFRNTAEAAACYSRFHQHVFVSREVMVAFNVYCSVERGTVLYNTNESNRILALAREDLPDGVFRTDEIKLIGVGKIEPVKGFDRLARIHRRLLWDGFPVHTYILGDGGKRSELESWIQSEGLTDSITLLGYQTNPYRWVANSDLFVCSSHSEGFSTAVTEALIVGTPVCTTAVSGMKELLGSRNEYGVVTANSEEELYQGIRRLLLQPALLGYYKAQASVRGQVFSTVSTVSQTEQLLMELGKRKNL